MTESREVLIDALFPILARWDPWDSGECSHETWRERTEALADDLADALVAHPVAVLTELENAPCPECGGTGDDIAAHDRGVRCDACGGSGRLGRDGVLRALGWDLDALAGHLDACLDTLGHTDVSSRGWLAEFASPQPCGVCGVAGGQHRRLRPASRAVRDELLGVMARTRADHDGDDYDGAVLDALLALPRSVDALREAGMLEQVGTWCELHGLCETGNVEGPGGETAFKFPQGTPVFARVAVPEPSEGKNDEG